MIFGITGEREIVAEYQASSLQHFIYTFYTYSLFGDTKKGSIREISSLTIVVQHVRIY